jgi:hypothetical protein
MNSRNPARTRWISGLLLFAFLFTAALAVYAPILHSPFGGTEYQTFLLPLKEQSLSLYDYITQWSPLAVHEIHFSRPLLKLLFLVEHRFWGHTPLAYRLLGLLIHVGCGLAAAGVVLAATRRREPAWLAGLVLTMHPAAVPAVRWISARGDLTATFFSLLALGALFRLLSVERRPPGVWRALLPSFFVFLALTGKELGMANFLTLPLVWLLWPGGKRDWRTGGILFASLTTLLALYIGWRFFLFGGIGGYGKITGIGEWPQRLAVLFWQTSGAGLIESIPLRTVYLALLIGVIVILAGRSALRWKRTGIIALLMAVFGFQSVIAGFQDDYYAYAPSAFLAILLITALVDCAAGRPVRARAVATLLLLPLMGFQILLTARANMKWAVELEVTERLMGAMEEQERLMEDGARFRLQLEGQDRDKRIRDQSKIINIYFHYLRGPNGPAIRRNPKMLPPNPPVLIWDGINLQIRPALDVGEVPPATKP